MAKLYVIRFKDKKESEPLPEQDVKTLILKGEVLEDDEISIHPNRFALAAKNYPEFDECFKDEEKTLFIDSKKMMDPHEGKTRIFDRNSVSLPEEAVSPQPEIPVEAPDIDEEVKAQKTMVFERPKEFGGTQEKKKSKIPKKSFLMIMLLAMIIYEMTVESDEEEEEKKQKEKVVLIQVRPQLPVSTGGKVDPVSSEKAYAKGFKAYTEDTVVGYRKAVEFFQIALKFDPENVNALSLLASTYLNLIESSSQDENTFTVINKLIELSKVKQVTSIEILISEIEFLAYSRRYDAAIQKIVEYSNVSGKIDPSLYYYIGWLYYLKREYANAMKYLNLIPASALPMPKLYYLRGLLHEENHEYDEAVSEFKRALQLNPKHARSVLSMVRISEKKGDLKPALKLVEFLTSHSSLQSPKEYIQTLIFRSKLAMLYNRPDVALESLQKAVKLDPKNEELKLEFYTLLSLSSSEKKHKSLAQMYSLVLEGEKLAKEGKTHEAISIFIQAKDTFPKSEVPMEKMGDLFYQIGNYQKAATNYTSALLLNPKSTHLAVKLIDSCIKNNEWDDAQKYLSKYRSTSSLKSSIDRLAGELAYSQKNYQQAITFYRKAMARDSVDTEVYVSYANILRELEQCKDAQFFYSVALKFDPLNVEAIIGSAKCVLKSDGIQLAVSRVQDELIRLPKARADLVAGIAEIYLLSGDSDKALQFADQAIEIDPNYPESYRIRGLVYLNKMLTQKDARKKALIEFKSFSDRKPSDPNGYIQRFELFLSEPNFELASEELNRVFEVSPRFPELHYRRAQLYAKIGRTKDAIQELDEELKINSRLVKALDDKGNLLLKLNQPDEAMKSFVKSMEINSQNPAPKIGAGTVNYMKRQFASSIALFSAALNLDKGNPEIYKKLGMAYRESGDIESATKFFQNYLDLAPDAPDRAEFEKYRQ